ncbi:aldose epimerase family protein [Pontiella sp.]|uniref:aldose epimerase family protein n=1 Tax=Pontiella sp. TaxID=2837462 RepID=UPI0035617284
MITEEQFGQTKDGQDVTAFVLENGGLKVKVINYGATIVSLEAPDSDGNIDDLVCGFDSIEEYQSDANPYFGCVCGRYANRIAKGKFSIDGRAYDLAVNNGPNALHGGLVGFDKKVWDAAIEGDAVKMTLVSPDGEEGYPGTLQVSVTYRLGADGDLRLEYAATTDQKTILNLTNHSYFNLAGKGLVYDQVITINADQYTVVDDDATPSGELRPVAGTEMDLRQPVPIGENIKAVQGRGYDHNYCINQKAEGELTLAAFVADPESGRTLECWTTEPGVQFYTANFVENVKGKNGAYYNAHESFCLETQHYPDSPNHGHFPSTELAPGETYTQTTLYTFGAA